MGKDIQPEEANKNGLQFNAKKQWADAVACFKEAGRLAPENSEYHENLGIALRKQGNDVEAAHALRRAISIKPRSPIALASLGELILEHCNTGGAVDCFRKAFDMAPGSGWGHVQMARAYLEGGNPESAAECAKLAFTLDPSLAQAYTVFASAAQELGRFSEAQEALERSIQIDSDQADAYFKLFYGKKAGQTDQDLIEAMQRVLVNGKRTLEEQRLLNYALGKAYEDLGEYGKAMQRYDLANRAAFDLQLGGRVFDRRAYSAEVDRSIRQFTKGFLEQATPLGSPSKTPIFVIGMMRSGTTLLEQILSRHSKIGAGGETGFWMRKGVQAVRPNIEGVRPSSPNQIAEEYLSMLGAISPGKPYITEKDPLNFRFLGEIRFTFPKARFIHCRRNPIDNCLSTYTTPYRIPADFSYNRQNIVFAYKEYLRLMDHWRALLPEETMIEIDYEDLAQEPEATTRKVIKFLGLDWEEACLQHEVSKGRIGTPSFWQARQPIYSSSVNRRTRFKGLLGEFTELDS
ncbi:MAG TPA: sulfotransferase [Fimbriimonadaceae bacterium]|jgi:tetratricopeptide (TPR) repeat protein